MPSFVLVRPQLGENIGSAARVMWNFGLNRMVLVAPRDGWPNPSAVALASGAGRLLDAARAVETTAEAVAGADFVLATTGRVRGLTKTVWSPEAAMAEARRRMADGGRVAILFGPERSGLENEDIALANGIISAPVNPEFPSLNLAQCVCLMAYEWQRSGGQGPERTESLAGTEWANQEEIEHLARHYEEQLDEARFFFPEAKAAGMKIALRNLWSRMPLTRADVQVLHGIMRQMRRWKERSD